MHAAAFLSPIIAKFSIPGELRLMRREMAD